MSDILFTDTWFECTMVELFSSTIASFHYSILIHLRINSLSAFELYTAFKAFEASEPPENHFKYRLLIHYATTTANNRETVKWIRC